MARFTEVTFNTGLVAPGDSYDHDVDVVTDIVNIGKVKVLPSGSTTGYVFEIFKKAARADVDRQYSSRARTQGNFFDPTNRSGEEVQEGFVLPYEDLDGLQQAHTRITNFDTVARSYDITLSYENPSATIEAARVSCETVAFVGTAGTLAHIPTSATIALYRNGGRLRRGVDYTVVGANITLDIPAGADEYF